MQVHDPPGSSGLRVLVTDVMGRRLRDPGVGRWLRTLAPATARGTMGVVLASDRAVRRLNREFAGEDHTTDVLSFPARPARGGADRGVEPPAGAWLGDVVIATGVAHRQARAAGHPVRAELRLLALHGLLHLLGYDHARDGGTMARLERRLCRRGGLGTSLAERGAGAGTRKGRRA